MLTTCSMISSLAVKAIIDNGGKIKSISAVIAECGVGSLVLFEVKSIKYVIAIHAMKKLL